MFRFSTRTLSIRPATVFCRTRSVVGRCSYATLPSYDKPLTSTSAPIYKLSLDQHGKASTSIPSAQALVQEAQQQTFEEGKVKATRVGEEIVDSASETLEQGRNKASELASDASNKANEVATEASYKVNQVKDETSRFVSEKAEEMNRTAQDAAETAKSTLSEASQKAQAVAQETSQVASEKVTEVAKTAEQLAAQAERKSEEVSDQAKEAAAVASEKVQEAGESISRAASKVTSFIKSTLLLLGTGAFLVYAYDSRAGVHRWIVLPAVMALTKDDPEQAHEWAVQFVGSGLAPVDCGEDDPSLLSSEVWGQTFDSPVGMAAGWDKHGTAIDGLFNLGFSYVEIGSVTPEPQAGNPKPRLFRVPELDAVVNRYGFNSEGHETVQNRLRQRVEKWVDLIKSHLPADFLPNLPHSAAKTVLAGQDFDVVRALLDSSEGQEVLVADRLEIPRSLKNGRVLGINLGKNKTSDPDSIDDFIKGVERLGPYADVLIINVSSPNTPGLRDLQKKGIMTELLKGVVEARNGLKAKKKPPVLVKIAPDVDEAQLKDIAEAVKASKIDGIIVSNTTISRPEPATIKALSTESNLVLAETGGLSGPPVKGLALKAISTLYELSDGKIPLVGCGGISSGQDALDFAKAGASLVQTYTGFIYHGVGLPRKIKDELMELLRQEGKSWKEVVGTGRKIREVTLSPVEKAKQKEALELREGSESKQQLAPLGERDFEDSLKEAKSDLDHLLKELASLTSSSTTTPTSGFSSGKPSPSNSTSTSSKSDSVPPINVVHSAGAEAIPNQVKEAAVPAPVAESFASNEHSSSPSSSLYPSATTTTPSSSSTASKTETISTQQGDKEPTSLSVASVFRNAGPKIDDSNLTVPAAALLDENAIRVLLDPVPEKKERASSTSVEEELPKPVKGKNERWV